MSFRSAVGDLFRSGRNSATGFAAQRIWERQFRKFGDMQDVSIDPRAKTMRFQFQLKGESEPITVTVSSYEVLQEGVHSFLMIKQASASREWIHLLLQDFAVQKRIPIPAKYANIVAMIL